MARLIILATMVAISLAKPELYKEKEDFQYSRSSSDEGTKAGYYGAQRGNMGGNYERAHNMDNLAQHQMGSLVSQVHGELGDATKAKAGNVFAASNSRGTYGSGHYDLSNVQGRNFQEGLHAYEDSAQSSAYRHSAASHNSAYTSNTKNSGYHAGQTGQYSSVASGDDNLYSDNYANNYDSASGYNSQSGYQAQGSANQYLANEHNSNVKTRLVSARPMRVVVRPGSTVTIPVAAQTYESTNQHSSSLYDQNSFNTEAEDLNSIDTQGSNGKAKHYESSYSYRKEWEKQNTKPVAVPLGIQTENPLAQKLYYGGGHTSGSHFNQASGYEAAHASQNSYNTKSSQALHQAGYNAQQYGSNSNAYKQGLNLENANQDALTATVNQNKPKNYQSSYSYHKSWERQGDPYVIVPTSSNRNSQQTQRLTDASYKSHHYGSQNQYQQLTNEDCDCEDDQGHIRVVRSYGQQWKQQSQNLEDLGQQTQNLEDLGQQTQNQRENLEDLGQQTQQQWGNSASFGQQTQNHWRGNLDQETQNQWNLGQQTQTQWNLGQQTQNQWSDMQDLGQQTQNQWGNLNDLGQQPLNGLEQQLQSSWTSTQQNTDQVAGVSWNTDQQIQGPWVINIKPKESSVQKTDSSIINPDDLQANSNIGKNMWIHTENTQTLNTYNHQNQEHNKWQTSYNNFGSGYNKPLHDLWDKINNLDHDSSSTNQFGQNNNNIHTLSTTTVKTTRGAERVGPWELEDVGRGDIGSEGILTKQTTEKISTHNAEQTLTENKKYKTPEEIETLTLISSSKPLITDSVKDNETDRSLTVISLQDQRENVQNDIISTTLKYSRNPQNNIVEDNKKPGVQHYNKDDRDLQSQSEYMVNQNTHEIQKPENLDQSQDLDKFNIENKEQVEQLVDFGQQQSSWIPDSQQIGQEPSMEFNHQQQNNNLEQQSQSWVEKLEIPPEKGTEQLTDFAQHNENIEQELTQEYQTLEQQLQSINHFESYHKTQEDSEQQLTDFGQHDKNLERQFEQINPLEGYHSVQKDNEQQLTDFAQQNKNLEQQFESINPLEVYRPAHKGTEQQLTDFGQHSENLEQQFHMINELESFRKPQKDTEQQLTDFGQQNINLEQQFEPFEQLNSLQQPQNLEQSLSDFSQHSESLGGYSGHNTQHEEPKIESFNKVTRGRPVEGRTGIDHYEKHNELKNTNDLGQETINLTQKNQYMREDQQAQQQQHRSLLEPLKIYDNKQRLDLQQQQVVEEPVVPIKVAEVERTLPEPTTAKPGFWNAVSSKFVNAKEKVASWFQRSK